MGNLILNGALLSLDLFGLASLASTPLKIAFYYWMRCSEFSADRAAILYDGGYEKMAGVCMRLAGFDKDISFGADLDAFMEQACDYEEMIDSSNWNKALEFLTLSQSDHPLLSVRAYEAREWVNSEQFASLTNVPL